MGNARRPEVPCIAAQGGAKHTNTQKTFIDHNYRTGFIQNVLPADTRASQFLRGSFRRSPHGEWKPIPPAPNLGSVPHVPTWNRTKDHLVEFGPDYPM